MPLSDKLDFPPPRDGITLISMSTIHAELPTKLLEEAELYVADGGATNLSELVAEALRRYLDSHSAVVSEQFIMEDVEWGLHGNR